jgi:hypothetical protein
MLAAYWELFDQADMDADIAGERLDGTPVATQAARGRDATSPLHHRTIGEHGHWPVAESSCR